MRHSRAILLIEGYGRNDLSPSLRFALDSHLADCHSCRARNEEAAAFAGFLAAAATETPVGFEEALEAVRDRTLRSAVAEPVKTPDWAGWIRRLAPLPLAVPVAAAAVLVLVLVVGRFPAGQSPDDVTSPDPDLSARTSGGADFSASRNDLPSDLDDDKSPSLANATPTGGDGIRSTDGMRSSPSTEEEPSPEVVAHRSGSRAGQAHEFVMVRKGTEVRIEWPHNGREHLIRKGSDPVTVQVAGGRRVQGSVWSDPEALSSPGSVTYYLVD